MSDPFASEIPAAEATFTISESARKRLSQIFAQEDDPNTMLRVKVSGGGCAGYQYGFDFESTITNDDRVFGDDEVKVVTLPYSVSSLVETPLFRVDGIFFIIIVNFVGSRTITATETDDG